MPGAPFEVYSEPLGCYPEEEPGCGQPDDYVLGFSSPFAVPIDVYMGDMVEWYVEGPEPNYLTVRNLRSFESGSCDDYWNWAYWAVGSMMIDY